MTIDEQERNLIGEIDFFNHNICWWNNEFVRVSNEINKIENNNFIGSSTEELDKLVATLTYLAGKANTERKTAASIENKIYKLRLSKELQFIQGDSGEKKGRKK